MNFNLSKRIFLLSLLMTLILSSCHSQQTSPENIVTTDCKQGSTYYKISQLQGKQHRSPFDGKQVSCVHGIVTTVDGEGFFLQDPNPDDDPDTSEGIYVDLSVYVNVKRGDEVMVASGTIREYNPAGLNENSLTVTILRADSIEILRNNQPLPEPIVLGEGGRTIPNQIIENDVKGNVGVSNALFDPDEDGMDFFESLEGMLVQINDAIAISSVNSYNEVFVLANMSRNATGLNGGVLLMSEDDPNPERLLIDDAFIAMPEIEIGDAFTSPIVGIVSYDFGNYRIQPIEKLVYKSNNLLEELTKTNLPELNERQISVATYNVKNLSHSESISRVSEIARQIVEELKMPDILVLQEVMDDDGLLDSGKSSAAENLEALTSEILELGGVEYRWFNIDPENNQDGGVDGGNIRVVILFRMDRGVKFLSALPGVASEEVSLLGEGQDLHLSLSPGLIWPGNSAFIQSRKPIIAQFQFMEQSFFVIGVHFNSKGPDGPLFGDEQPPDLASETQRIAQAKAVNGFVKDILELDPQAFIIVAGDMNDFPWTEAIQTLKSDQLENLTDSIDGNQGFTYIYEGNGQIFDQIFVSKPMRKKVKELHVLNINSVLPANDQVSDHDPVVAIFDFGTYE
jgi:predicted extracellular nuclease